MNKPNWEERKSRVYQGMRNGSDWTKKQVVVIHKSCGARLLKHIERHSPDGFEWGYGGSGPSDLALSILTNFAGPKIAQQFYMEFKFDFVARFDEKSWELQGWVIYEWLKRKIQERGLSDLELW